MPQDGAAARPPGRDAGTSLLPLGIRYRLATGHLKSGSGVLSISTVFSFPDSLADEAARESWMMRVAPTIKLFALTDSQRGPSIPLSVVALNLFAGSAEATMAMRPSGELPEGWYVVEVGRSPSASLIRSVAEPLYDGAQRRLFFVQLDGLDAPLLGDEDLVLNKEETGRPKDKLDLEALRRLAASPSPPQTPTQERRKRSRARGR